MGMMVDMTGDRRDAVEVAEDPVERTRRELVTVRRAWSVLAEGSVPAAASLVALATGARSELVRVQAATAVLDRVGLGKVEGVVVADVSSALDAGAGQGGGGASAALVLASRMRALQAAGGDVSVIRGHLVGEGGAADGQDGVQAFAGDVLGADPDSGAGADVLGPLTGVLGPSDPVACRECGYMPGDGDDVGWCTWCEAPIPDPRDA